MTKGWMVLALALVLSACSAGKKAPLAVAGPADPMGDHCRAEGGTIETREGPDGPAKMCRLQDGRICAADTLLSEKLCADPRL